MISVNTNIYNPQISLNSEKQENDKKKTFLRLSDRDDLVRAFRWEGDAKFVKFEEFTTYCQVDVFSKLRQGDLKSFYATSHALAYVNRSVITKKILEEWVRFMSETRIDKPLTEKQIETIINFGMKNKNKKPKARRRVKYVFNKELNLTKSEKLRLIAQDKVETNIRNLHKTLDGWEPGEPITREKVANIIRVKRTTLSGWKKKFPELYADADEKFERIKELATQEFVGEPMCEDELADNEVFIAFKNNCKDKQHPIHNKNFVKRNWGRRFFHYEQMGETHFLLKKGDEVKWIIGSKETEEPEYDMEFDENGILLYTEGGGRMYIPFSDFKA